MSVTIFKEIHNGRTGGDTLTKSSATKRSERVFRAVTNSNLDDDITVLSHAASQGLFPGALHPNDSQMHLLRRRARNEPFSKRVWIARFMYSDSIEATDNPLFDPAEIEWNTEQFQRPFFKDKDGNGIVNSAGDPFDPPAEGDDSRVTATIRKNLASVPSWILTYRDATNDATFTLDGVSIGTGKAKINSVRVSPVQDRNNIEYRVVSLLMHFNTDGWDLSLLDQGFRQIKGTTNEREAITNDGDGVEPSQPALLDGSGKVLTNPTAATAVFLDFTIYTPKDFSVLPLS